MTIAEISTQRSISPDALRKRWSRAGLGAFSLQHEPSPEEVAAIFGGKVNGHTYGQENKDNTHPVRLSAPLSTKGRIRTDVQTPVQRTFGQRFVLWSIMALCAVISTHNMLYIADQVTGANWVAWSIMGLFTVAPFALLYAGSGKVIPFICIAFEVFCNTVGIFRGLAGLKESPFERYETGSFIDSLATLTNCPHRSCAVLVSFIMAALVAVVFLTSLNLAKK